MFDPLQNIALVERALTIWQGRGAEVTWPNFGLDYDHYTRQWDEFYWSCKVTFACGHRFTASESHSRGWKGIHLRKLSYRLMQPDGQLIFQIDTHRTPIPYQECPHLHLGPSENVRLEEDSPTLKDVSLKSFDFQKMCEWVDKYLNEDGKMPWQS